MGQEQKYRWDAVIVEGVIVFLCSASVSGLSGVGGSKKLNEIL